MSALPEPLRELAQPLPELVRTALERYFADLNGQPPADLYEFVIAQVERPLLEIVMRETRGNISRAAQVLGINRATLRTKLAKHGLQPR
jgi:Fis family transcriptional regulator